VEAVCLFYNGTFTYKLKSVFLCICGALTPKHHLEGDFKHHLPSLADMFIQGYQMQVEGGYVPPVFHLLVSPELYFQNLTSLDHPANAPSPASLVNISNHTYLHIYSLYIHV